MDSGNGLSVDQFYSEAKGSGILLGLRCDRNHVTVPPRHTCRVCGSRELTVVELSKLGTVISFTVVYTKSGSFPLDVPYILALVNLDEGGNLLGVVERGAVSGNPIIPSHLRVKVCFKTLSQDPRERPRIFFQFS